MAGPVSPCWSDCRYCTSVSAGTSANLRRMIVDYPRIARTLLRDASITQLNARAAARSLTPDEIKEEIDAGRPVIAGITPMSQANPLGPQHAVLIIGYDGDDDSMTLTVNDPFPYTRPNPYLAVGAEGGQGQYTIDYRRFKNRLQWTETIYGISER